MEYAKLMDFAAADDRRQFERKRLIVDLHFDGGDATGIASTRDIGLGGLYLTTKAKLSEGTTLLMHLTLGETELVLKGVVVYIDEGKGVGVRFESLNKETEDLLRRELPLL